MNILHLKLLDQSISFKVKMAIRRILELLPDGSVIGAGDPLHLLSPERKDEDSTAATLSTSIDEMSNVEETFNGQKEKNKKVKKTG